MRLYTTQIKTPIGWIDISGTAQAIRSIRMATTRHKCNHTALPEVIQQCILQLTEYFQRQRTSFELPLDYSGAPLFYQKVWDALRQIPYGHTASYLDIARQLRNPKATRAVGQANRANPIAIIVPCHRVIAANGQLGGYFYGTNVKRYLLQLENPTSFACQPTLF